MKSIRLLLTCSLFVHLLCAPAIAESGKETLARIYERAGSLETLRSLQTAEIIGQVAAFGLAGEATTTFLAPDRAVQSIAMGPLVIKQILNADRGWMLDQNQSKIELSGYELESMVTGVYISSYGFLRDDTRAATIEYLGPKEQNGIACKEFHIAPVGGSPITVLIDTLTGDLIRHTTSLDDIELVTDMSDFREVDGVRVAFRTVTSSPIPQLNMTMTATKCKFNHPIDSAVFTFNEDFPARFEFSGGARSTKAQLEKKNGHLFITATVNGSRPARFLLDSGAGSNLFSLELVGELGLKVEGDLPTKGVAGYAAVGLVDIEALTIGEMTLHDQTAAAMSFRGPLEAALGEFDGILGYEFFRHFVVQLNIQAGEIIIYTPEAAPEPIGVGIPLEFTMRIPQAEASIMGQRGLFVIDLGNNGGVLAHQRFAESVGLDTLLEFKRSSGQGIGGVGGHLSISAAVAPVFSLGGLELRDVPIGLLAEGDGLSASERIAGNIGADFLRSYNLTFDYPNQRIWLQELD